MTDNKNQVELAIFPSIYDMKYNCLPNKIETLINYMYQIY